MVQQGSSFAPKKLLSIAPILWMIILAISIFTFIELTQAPHSTSLPLINVHIAWGVIVAVWSLIILIMSTLPRFGARFALNPFIQLIFNAILVVWGTIDIFLIHTACVYENRLWCSYRDQSIHGVIGTWVVLLFLLFILIYTFRVQRKKQSQSDGYNARRGSLSR